MSQSKYDFNHSDDLNGNSCDDNDERVQKVNKPAKQNYIEIKTFQKPGGRFCIENCVFKINFMEFKNFIESHTTGTDSVPQSTWILLPSKQVQTCDLGNKWDFYQLGEDFIVFFIPSHLYQISLNAPLTEIRSQTKRRWSPFTVFGPAWPNFNFIIAFIHALVASVGQEKLVLARSQTNKKRICTRPGACCSVFTLIAEKIYSFDVSN